MDTDEFKSFWPNIRKPMRNVGSRDNDIARVSSCRLVTNGELSFALSGDPRLRIGMDMQSRSSAGFGIDQEERYRTAEIVTLETNRSTLAWLRLLVAKDRKHPFHSL
jgi:hypothetical protein